MNILIIGANGFIGKHLTNFFHNKRKINVFTIDIKDSIDLIGNNKFVGDIKEKSFLKKCINESQPDLVYYLISFFSLNDIESFTSSVNNSLTCLKNLFDNLKSKQRLIFIGSSAQYGNVPLSLQPVNENTDFFPISSYGVYKIFEEYEISRLANKYNIDYVGARIFNVTGPGEPTRMVGGSIVSQLKKSNKVKMGNLSSKRDFVDVRDVVSALYIIGANGKSKEIYNICSGKSISIKKYLELIIKELGIKPEISIDRNRINPNDLKDLVGDNSKIVKELNWDLKYDLNKSLKDLVKES